MTNTSGAMTRFVWGHHCVLGPPLVAAGARLRAPCRAIVTPPEPWEDSARLEPAQRSAWPTARLRGGGEVDLSCVPGPEAALLGIAGLRGALLPIYGLAVLLGYPAPTEAPRLVVIVIVDEQDRFGPA